MPEVSMMWKWSYDRNDTEDGYGMIIRRVRKDGMTVASFPVVKSKRLKPYAFVRAVIAVLRYNRMHMDDMPDTIMFHDQEADRRNA
jgi:hypothetical protein